jgi:hypothetical protein
MALMLIYAGRKVYKERQAKKLAAAVPDAHDAHEAPGGLSHSASKSKKSSFRTGLHYISSTPADAAAESNSSSRPVSTATTATAAITDSSRQIEDASSNPPPQYREVEVEPSEEYQAPFSPDSIGQHNQSPVSSPVSSPTPPSTSTVPSLPPAAAPKAPATPAAASPPIPAIASPVSPAASPVIPTPEITITRPIADIKAGRAKDIGYFNPDPPTGNSPPRDGGETIYRNVYAFANSLRKKGAAPEFATLPQYVHVCLLGTARSWYDTELKNITRVGLRHGTVEDWCEFLEERFGVDDSTPITVANPASPPSRNSSFTPPVPQPQATELVATIPNSSGYSNPMIFSSELEGDYPTDLGHDKPLEMPADSQAVTRESHKHNVPQPLHYLERMVSTKAQIESATPASPDTDSQRNAVETPGQQGSVGQGYQTAATEKLEGAPLDPIKRGSTPSGGYDGAGYGSDTEDSIGSGYGDYKDEEKNEPLEFTGTPENLRNNATK